MVRILLIAASLYLTLSFHSRTLADEWSADDRAQYVTFEYQIESRQEAVCANTHKDQMLACIYRYEELSTLLWDTFEAIAKWRQHLRTHDNEAAERVQLEINRNFEYINNRLSLLPREFPGTE